MKEINGVKIHTADDLFAFEDGKLTQEQIVELFASLVRTGQAWTLQGFYGRTASELIEEGYISRSGKILKLN